MAKSLPLVEIGGVGALYLGGDGQCLDCLKEDPLVKANAPTGGYKKHGFDTAHISRYEGTDFIQWQGRRADGCFHAYGQILKLTAAGRRAIRAETAAYRAEVAARAV
jgi:hypothetical protein